MDRIKNQNTNELESSPRGTPNGQVARLGGTMLPFLWAFIFLFSTNVFALNLTASYYSKQSLVKEGTWKNGKETLMANGHHFSDHGLTGACRLFPFGTKLRVTNLSNGRSVTIVVTDRIGKRFAKTRIDLSKGAFELIADLKTGIIKVEVQPINKGASNEKRNRSNL